MKKKFVFYFFNFYPQYLNAFLIYPVIKILSLLFSSSRKYKKLSLDFITYSLSRSHVHCEIVSNQS